jgi:hypothetical protein
MLLMGGSVGLLIGYARARARRLADEAGIELIPITPREATATYGAVAVFVGASLALHLRRHDLATRVIALDNLRRRGSELNVPRLRAAGVEARTILFARPDREGLAQSTAAERATIAELWLTRDWTLYQRWTATPVRNWTAAGIPAADGNLARGAVVEAGRDFVARLSADLQEAGLSTRYPLIIWRDREGFMKACACSDRRSWVFIRDDLDAPDRIDPPDVVPVDPSGAQALPGDGVSESLPYPDLAPFPPADGTAPGAPSAPAPASSPAPRKAPEAKQAEDTTFF